MVEDTFVPNRYPKCTQCSEHTTPCTCNHYTFQILLLMHQNDICKLWRQEVVIFTVEVIAHNAGGKGQHESGSRSTGICQTGSGQAARLAASQLSQPWLQSKPACQVVLSWLHAAPSQLASSQYYYVYNYSYQGFRAKEGEKIAEAKPKGWEKPCFDIN